MKLISQKVADLIESVKYGQDAAPYGGDLREDLIEVLKDYEQMRDDLDHVLDQFPTPATFESIGPALISNPQAFATFGEIMGELESIKEGMET